MFSITLIYTTVLGQVLVGTCVGANTAAVASQIPAIPNPTRMCATLSQYNEPWLGEERALMSYVACTHAPS